MKRRAVFLDRDGTINEEMGYINHIDRGHLLARSAQAIRRINDSDFLALVVTNQSGVARGLFDLSLVFQVNALLSDRLEKEAGARLDGIYVCPHHPDAGVPPFRADCACRKPRPGLLEQGAREHDLDLSASYMIGDTLRDMETARNAGVAGVLVLTGYGRGEAGQRLAASNLAPLFVAKDLFEAVEWILEREEKA